MSKEYTRFAFAPIHALCGSFRRGYPPGPTHPPHQLGRIRPKHVTIDLAIEVLSFPLRID